MEGWDDRAGAPHARAGARQVSYAVAERERGRRRLNATTATVGFASVVAAGAVAVVLPGSTHPTVSSHGSSPASTSTGGSSSGTSSGASSRGTANSGSSSSSSSNSNSSSSSSNLQAPANPPVQYNGGGQATSGGSH